jgi:hypothetical protein
MAPSFPIYLALLLLWPFGLVVLAALSVGLALPTHRPMAWRGLRWSLVGGVMTLVVAALVWKITDPASTASPDATNVLAMFFLDGVAVTATIWWVGVKYRNNRQRPSN